MGSNVVTEQPSNVEPSGKALPWVADNDLLLAGHDATQVAAMEEALILVDDDDHQIGTASKRACHAGDGVRHRAFSVVLFNERRLLLVQRRASSKITFPGVWANSCCSHPLDNERERVAVGDLGVRRAAVRRLGHELGINGSALTEESIRPVTRFEYVARMNEEWSEHELVHVLMVRGNFELHPNRDEIDDIRWVSQEELDSMAAAEPLGEVVIAPWFELMRVHLLGTIWAYANGSEPRPDSQIHRFGEDGSVG